MYVYMHYSIWLKDVPEWNRVILAGVTNTWTKKLISTSQSAWRHVNVCILHV